MSSFTGWLGRIFGLLLTPDGRRAWAFLALLMASGIMTVFAAVAMYMLTDHSAYVFWLGLAAHVQLLLCLTGFMAMFVKRDLDLDTKYGSLKLKDNPNDISVEHTKTESLEVTRTTGSPS